MKPPDKSKRPKPQRPIMKVPSAVNKRLTEQTRKILGKHYANKHGVK
jgi:hypothetical protein